MAIYGNGKRISGIRDFPAYTWAEYHALPVAKRPKVWKCTDRDYTEIPDVFYKDVPIAGVVVSNYWAQVSSGVSTSDYIAIGFAEGGIWDEKIYFSVDRNNALNIKSQTASYTIPSNRTPIRMYFVKNNTVNATPLA